MLNSASDDEKLEMGEFEKFLHSITNANTTAAFILRKDASYCFIRSIKLFSAHYLSIMNFHNSHVAFEVSLEDCGHHILNFNAYQLEVLSMILHLCSNHNEKKVPRGRPSGKNLPVQKPFYGNVRNYKFNFDESICNIYTYMCQMFEETFLKCEIVSIAKSVLWFLSKGSMNSVIIISYANKTMIQRLLKKHKRRIMSLSASDATEDFNHESHITNLLINFDNLKQNPTSLIPWDDIFVSTNFVVQTITKEDKICPIDTTEEIMDRYFKIESDTVSKVVFAVIKKLLCKLAEMSQKFCILRIVSKEKCFQTFFETVHILYDLIAPDILPHLKKIPLYESAVHTITTLATIEDPKNLVTQEPVGDFCSEQNKASALESNELTSLKSKCRKEEGGSPWKEVRLKRGIFKIEDAKNLVTQEPVGDFCSEQNKASALESNELTSLKSKCRKEEGGSPWKQERLKRGIFKIEDAKNLVKQEPVGDFCSEQNKESTPVSSRTLKGAKSKSASGSQLRTIRPQRKTASNLKSDREALMKIKILDNCQDGLTIKDCGQKGRGVFTTKCFEKDEFVVEYVGRLLSGHEGTQLERLQGDGEGTRFYLYYFYFKEKCFCIDATAESNYLGRLINHSRKNPLLLSKVVEVESLPRLVFVAKSFIPVGVELTYDYGETRKHILDVNPWLKNC
ncbi:uncharacterized protein LOC122498865 isoform X2 [Leptopilina heterotoma]|uniref:uncharacterized protein LOC122498865 isoform X2 n=1 Tax=Leptopilina heterotoma TaxID=63436 RepID=UPI001CAA1D69|nr:uncharacterized protein LOC122498865 isoform X2 [Leptopilina heterotoma]XP_043462782.1 uncharacterized protein LOC122498865 isoform X2 [Leptopilina heterotoma]